MRTQRTHPLQSCWDLVLASVKADALDAALGIKLFDALVEPARAEDVAARLSLDPVNLGHLLELLWSMDLLERTQVHPDAAGASLYRASSGARRFLANDTPDYCGDAWAFRLQSLREFGGRLRDHLRARPDDEAPLSVPTDRCWATLAQTKIVQEQRAVTAEAALSIVDRLPGLHGVGRFLDLGGGPGMVAIALARALPDAHGTLFDLPATATVARQNIEAAQLNARLSVLGGDLTRDDIGHGYDLIWCSSVLHFVPQLARTLATIRAALAPGGMLVSIHAEVPLPAPPASAVLAYYLPLLMRGHHVGRQGELAGAMLAAGFESVSTFESGLFPFAPVQVLACR